MKLSVDVVNSCMAVFSSSQSGAAGYSKPAEILSHYSGVALYDYTDQAHTVNEKLHISIQMHILHRQCTSRLP